MKRLPEKMMIAAIILSCGFVVQADPPEPSPKTKGPEDVEMKRMMDSADSSSRDGKETSASTQGDRRAPW